MRSVLEHASAAPFKPGFWAVFRREVHIMAHSPFYYLFMFILPLGAFGIFAAVFTTEIPRDLPIIACDRDDTRISRELVRMFDASPSLAVVETVHSMSEGEAVILRGGAYAILYIPENLERDVKRGQSPAISVYFNNQWMLVSGLLSRSVREIVGTFSAKLDVYLRMAKGEPPAEALQRYEPIRLDVHPLFNPNMNYRYFLLPALLVGLIQLFVMAVAVRALGSELRHGTATVWLECAGNRTWVAVLGKLLPSSLCFMLLTLFTLALCTRYMHVPFYGNLGFTFLASALFVLAYQSMGFAFVALTANLRLALSLAGFYTGPALAFAGITYPMIGMPLGARIWADATPLSYYLYVLLQQVLRGAPIQASAPWVFVLFLFATVPPLLLMRRMGRLMRDSKYWGRI